MIENTDTKLDATIPEDIREMFADYVRIIQNNLTNLAKNLSEAYIIDVAHNGPAKALTMDAFRLVILTMKLDALKFAETIAAMQKSTATWVEKNAKTKAGLQ